MKKTMSIIFSVLFLIGCASVPFKHSFDPKNFDSMNNVALLVRESKIKAYDSSFALSKRSYDVPIVWKDSAFAQPISTGGIPFAKAGSGVFSLGIFWDPYGPLDKAVVYKDDTERLHRHIKGYDVKSSFGNAFVERFHGIKSCNFLPLESVVDIYNRVWSDYEELVNKSRSAKTTVETKKGIKEEVKKREVTFQNELRHHGADTFILLEVSPWGFKKHTSFGVQTQKGNFLAFVTVSITRLSDGKIIWHDVVAADLSDTNEDRTLGEFLQDDQLLSVCINKLADTFAFQLVGQLTNQK